MTSTWIAAAASSAHAPQTSKAAIVTRYRLGRAAPVAPAPSPHTAPATMSELDVIAR